VNEYNQRLFEAGGLRSYYHYARYHWIRRKVEHRGPLRVIELGCHDGKTIDFLPNLERYVGLDADWENGLSIARARHGGRDKVEFRKVQTPAALSDFKDGEFDAAIALETLEHIPDDMMKDYLAELSRVTSGRIYVSVPNEMGPVFLAKFLAKQVRYGGAEKYTPSEIVSATLFQPQRVERDNHKGFDYRQMIRDVAEHFEIESVEGLPPLFLPPALSLTVGIVGRKAG
jgi:cyclopropane fatty-acyl-phospholipid synthase-like methyltransferase